MRTCRETFIRQKAGVAAETVRFESSTGEFTALMPQYYLRPETIESLFVLHEVTGDGMYREWGWDIFQRIETACRAEHGYAGVKDVTQPIGEGGSDGRQFSYFLAETVKYLYLLFAHPAERIRIGVGLNTHVFTTEAHPFRIQINQTQCKAAGREEERQAAAAEGDIEREAPAAVKAKIAELEAKAKVQRDAREATEAHAAELEAKEEESRRRKEKEADIATARAREEERSKREAAQAVAVEEAEAEKFEQKRRKESDAGEVKLKSEIRAKEAAKRAAGGGARGDEAGGARQGVARGGGG